MSILNKFFFLSFRSFSNIFFLFSPPAKKYSSIDLLLLHFSNCWLFLSLLRKTKHDSTKYLLLLLLLLLRRLRFLLHFHISSCLKRKQPKKVVKNHRHQQQQTNKKSRSSSNFFLLLPFLPSILYLLFLTIFLFLFLQL